MIARTHQLFGEALDQPEDSREVWLRGQCGPDEALYAAVLRLLKADATASLLDADVAMLAEPLVQPDAQQQQADDSRYLGTRFGPYQVVSLLGRGGMGSVWLAERRDGDFRQQVAIKLLAGALPSAEALQRFAQERQILARLQHPNIARVLDGGSVEGVPWFAMDFVQGVALDEAARRDDLSLQQRLLLLGKVVAAVHFAHQNLVVHRDLKPSNILVDTAGEPHLLDFGVAKLLDASSDLTASQAPLSMAYAAPEQLLGEPVTTATDVYSLGVILYELLTGNRPHKPRANGSLALLQAITDTDPLPPSRAVGGATTRQSKQLRGDLDTIVLTCLSRNPARRYASAQALGDDLAAYLKQQPIRARPESWRYRSGKFIRRNRVGVMLATLAVSALLALSLFALLQAREAEQQRQLALTQAQRATAVQDFLIGVFDQQRPDATRGASVSAKDLLDRAERTLDVGADRLKAETRAVLLQTLAQLRFDLGDYEAALALGDKLLLQATQETGAGSEQSAVARLERGESLLQLGQAAVAVADCTAALPVLRAASADTAAAVRALLQCATVARLNDDLDGAAKLLSEADSRLPAAHADAAELRHALLRQQAMLSIAEGDHEAAITSFTQLIAQLQASEASAPSELATALHSRAISEKLLGRSALAVTDFRAALALHQRVFGATHDLSIQTQSALATVLNELGETEEGRKMGRDALQLARQSMGNDNPTLAILLNQAAVQAYRQQDFAGAAALMEEAIGINTRAYGPQHVDTLALLNNLSSLQRLLGRFDASRSSAQQVLTRLAGNTERGFNERQAHIRLAFIAHTTGNPAAQAEHARWVLAALQEQATPNVEELPEALGELAMAQSQLKQTEAALDSAQQQERAARQQLEAGSEMLGKHLASVARVVLEAGQAERALALSNEVLGTLPQSEASWNRSAIRIAALVRLRALQQLGQTVALAEWAEVVAQHRHAATVDDAKMWKTVEPWLPR